MSRCGRRTTIHPVMKQEWIRYVKKNARSRICTLCSVAYTDEWLNPSKGLNRPGFLQHTQTQPYLEWEETPWGPAEWSGNPRSPSCLILKKGSEEIKAQLEPRENFSEIIRCIQSREQPPFWVNKIDDFLFIALWGTHISEMREVETSGRRVYGFKSAIKLWGDLRLIPLQHWGIFCLRNA